MNHQAREVLALKLLDLIDKELKHAMQCALLSSQSGFSSVVHYVSQRAFIDLLRRGTFGDELEDQESKLFEARKVIARQPTEIIDESAFITTIASFRQRNDLEKIAQYRVSENFGGVLRLLSL